MGIIHRDLKLENILIKNSKYGLQSLKIADFGISKIVYGESLTNTVCGTQYYVAPEIIN